MPGKGYYNKTDNDIKGGDMKRSILLPLVFLAAGFFMQAGAQSGGITVSLEKPVDPFEKIEMRARGLLRFHRGENFRAVVTLDAGTVDKVNLSVKNRVLTVSLDNEDRGARGEIIFDLWAPGLSSLLISGTGRAEWEEAISGSSFTLEIPGAGTASGPVDCGELSVKLWGSGGAVLDGIAEKASISLGGSGDFRGEGLRIDRASVMMAGSGKASLWVQDRLQAGVYGMGSLSYRGNPRTEIETFSFGTVAKLD
jgi:hypothetical protein